MWISRATLDARTAALRTWQAFRKPMLRPPVLLLSSRQEDSGKNHWRTNSEILGTIAKQRLTRGAVGSGYSEKPSLVQVGKPGMKAWVWALRPSTGTESSSCHRHACFLSLSTLSLRLMTFFSFIFFYWNRITSLPPPFAPSSPSHVPSFQLSPGPPCTPNLIASFPLIIICPYKCVCARMCACVYVYLFTWIYIKTIRLSLLLVFVCIWFQSWLLCIGQSIRWLISEKS